MVNCFFLWIQLFALIFIKELNHILWINKWTEIKGRCVNIYLKGVKLFFPEYSNQEVFHELEIAHVHYFFLSALVLSLRVKQDGEHFSHVSEQVFVNAFVSDHICLQFWKFEFLSVLVQNCFGSSSLRAHCHWKSV